MAWSEVTEMNFKIKFIHDYLSNKYTFTELCSIHNISRKTGYKTVDRYNNEGPTGLISRSKTHSNHPFTTKSETKKFLLDIKNKYRYWGPKKVKQWLHQEYPDKNWPAASTIGTIFKEHGLTNTFKRKPRVSVYNKQLANITAPNDVWSADFKGQFKLANKQYCYPLTISDNYSRYLIQCKTLPGTTLTSTKHGFIEAFQEYGLPKVIRTDNGIPFSSQGACGLSRLSLWFIKLGITPERIPHGRPDCNGRHERMHRTLKAETTIPPGDNFSEQQDKFNEFINLYNNIRPHYALDGQRPKDLYVPSERMYHESNIKPPEYDLDMTVRRVRHNGYINFASYDYYLGEIFYGEDIGLKKMDEDTWVLLFYKTIIGTLNTLNKLLDRY